MSRIRSLLVTGSNGFVGKSFLDYLGTLPVEELPLNLGLVSRGVSPQISDELAAHTAVTRIQADLAKPWEFEYPATHVVHLAADGSSSAYSIEAADRFVSMVGNLVAWCRQLDDPVLFHASSGACFGHISIEGADEHAGPELGGGEGNSAQKKGIFVKSRLAAEANLKSAAAEGLMDLRIGRLYSFIGRHLYEKPHYAASAFVNMALEAKDIALAGNPRTTRSYLSADDMSDWIYKSLRSGVGSEILSIGSDKPVTMKELADYIATATGSKVTCLNPTMAGDYYVASNQETRARLLVAETTSWQTSTDEYLAFIREMRSDEHR